MGLEGQFRLSIHNLIASETFPNLCNLSLYHTFMTRKALAAEQDSLLLIIPVCAPITLPLPKSDITRVGALHCSCLIYNLFQTSPVLSLPFYRTRLLTLSTCSFQTESADEWSYQKGLEGGWIPSDPSERLYPGLCSNSSTNSTA